MDSVASSKSQQQTLQQVLQLVGFCLGNEEYGVHILQVREIIRIQELTRVPNTPPYVEGIMNLRGKVIPIISLRKRLGLEDRDHAEQTRIVVLEAGGMLIGFIVDSVSEVLRIPVSLVTPVPRIGSVEREFVSGIGKLDDRLVLLLDVDRIVLGAEAELAATAGA